MASSFASIQHQQHHQQQIQSKPQPQSNSLVARELKLIASSFVKQYYTLLNKAPCYIHNFYNHDSTFIHGTIEMGSENHTEPVVGRERIEEKMRELKLNDCRAKIKQIDCLETLAGGLVIQVIGELSNNGKPMRRFLQTFVLAPSPDQARHDNDSHAQNKASDNRRGVQISEGSSNSSHNQKFYVLNSIFRYQDDGPDSEFEDDSVSVQANTSVESADANNDQNDANEQDHSTRLKTIVVTQSQPHQQHQNSNAASTVATTKTGALKPQPAAPDVANEQKRTDVKLGALNGVTNPDKKSETSEKPLIENGKFAASDNQGQVAQATTGTPGTPGTPTTTTSQNPLTGTVITPATRPSNEPKTWANMVRNTPFPSTVQHTTVTKEQPSPSVASTNQAQSSPQQQQIPHQHQQSSQQSQNDQSQQNNNNNRRRHVIRKTTNKSGNNGRTLKNRPPRPAAASGPASTGRPAA